jgi:hypothetical protein
MMKDTRVQIGAVDWKNESDPVVGMIDDNRNTSVNLFEQHDPKQPVWKRHWPETQGFEGLCARISRMSVGPADHEMQASRAALGLLLNEFGKLRRCQRLAALIQNNGNSIIRHSRPQAFGLFKFAQISCCSF